MAEITNNFKGLSLNQQSIKVGEVDLRNYLNEKNLQQDNKEVSHMNLLYQFVLDNVNYGQLCADISAVEYNKYREETLEEVPVLRDVFCDDAIFIKLIPADTFKGFNNTPDECSYAMKQMHSMIDEFLEELNRDEDNKLPYPGKTRAVRSSVFKGLNGSIDLTEIRPQRKSAAIETVERSFHDIVSMSTDRLEEYLKFEEKNLPIYKEKHPDWKERGIGYIALKVSFSQWGLEEAIVFIEEHRKEMAQKDMFLWQFDLTKDFGCSFDADDLEDHLITIGHKTTAKAAYVKAMVGGNCVMYKEGPNEKRIRYKVYNKFAQSMESHSVSHPIGNHVHNWINNFEAPIRESIAKSTPYGFTRVELSFYGDNCKGDLIRHKNELRKYEKILLKEKQFFQCSIQDQWNSFSEELSCNVFLIDCQTREYVLGMWCHREMGRIGGTRGKLSENMFMGLDSVIEFVTSHYSIKNLPMHLVQFIPTDNDNIMNVEVSKYLKVGEVTLVWNGKEGTLCYDASEDPQRYQKRPRDNKPEEMGMASNDIIELMIPEERVRIRRTQICKSIIDNTNIYIDYHIRHSYFVQTLESRKEEIIINRLKNALYTGSSRPLFHEQSDNELRIYALKRYGTKYGCKYTMVTQENKRIISNQELTEKIERIIDSENMRLNRDMYTHANLEYIFKFYLGPLRKNKGGWYYKNIMNFEFNPTLVDPEAKPEFINISENIKHIDSTSINTFNEGDVLEVTGMKFYMYRVKRKIMILVEGKYYNSNQFLEEILTEERSTMFKIQIGPNKKIKTHNNRTVRIIEN
jgi:hypothetical protein